MGRKKSVLLVSGGLDSAANLALCVERDEPCLVLTSDYGQRAAAREIASARALCDYYDVPHQIVDLRWLGKMGGSSLTDSARGMPRFECDQLDDPALTQQSAKAVWVPNRNGVLINVAAAYAERLGAVRVVVGFNREEAATFPDNTVEFLEKATAALAYSTANRIEAFSYTSLLDKREIVQALRQLSKPFPFERVWSCYQGENLPCGICESCQRLARAVSL